VESERSTCSTPCAPSRFASLITASNVSNGAGLALLSHLCTPSSVLFDPRYTSYPRPSAAPPFRTFPPSPTAERRTPHVPSTISLQNLDPDPPAADMDKRHPSSFQQLEKLGEGTYATVCRETIISALACYSDPPFR